MATETIKIGTIKIRKIENDFCLSDVVKHYNEKNDKNRSHVQFNSINENRVFVEECCRLMNILFETKKYNSDSIFTYNRIDGFGRTVTFSNVFVFAKYMSWCFPQHDSKLSKIVYQWISDSLDLESEIMEFCHWLYKNETHYMRDNGFDPLLFLREIVLIKKFLYKGSSDSKTTEEVITLNKSLIEVKLPIKDRLLVLSRNFTK